MIPRRDREEVVREVDVEGLHQQSGAVSDALDGIDAAPLALSREVECFDETGAERGPCGVDVGELRVEVPVAGALLVDDVLSRGAAAHAAEVLRGELDRVGVDVLVVLAEGVAGEREGGPVGEREAGEDVGALAVGGGAVGGEGGAIEGGEGVEEVHGAARLKGIWGYRAAPRMLWSYGRRWS